MRKKTMDEKAVNQNNYDAVSISQPGRAKRSVHIQDALFIEQSRLNYRPGQYFKLFADMFRCENVSKRYI